MFDLPSVSVCPIVGLIILFWDRTIPSSFMDVGDLPGSLSCPGPFGRLAARLGSTET